MAPKLERVFKGLCGVTEISPVCMGLEQQD